MYDKRISYGSQWLKWDCHIHTPISYENEYKGNFSSYIENLKNAALAHETDVIIINDYFSIEGYKEVIKYCNKDEETQSYYLSLDNDKRLYVLPGIELRIDNFTDNSSAVNIHIFFNQKLSSEVIEENFINKLEVIKNDKKIELKEKNMIKLGVALDKNENYKESLCIDKFTTAEKKKYINIAYKSITIKYDNLIKTKEKLEKLFNNDSDLANNCVLMVVPFKGHGSIGEIGEKIWDGRAGEIKKEILSKADICFASNKKDINFLLGKSNGADTFKIKELFNSIKPCIWGSDAHKEESLCYPSNGNSLRYTWIKALPCFDGLKQIIFEPEYRVKIQEEKPERKINYRIIDRVCYINDNKNIYPKKEIYLNQNLNTVIGGKSSGKSFLLNNIAMAVNGVQQNDQYRRLKDKYPFDFEVHWRDGSIDKLNSLEQHNRKVKYINQMYITQFIENADKLDEEIFSILLENEEVLNLKKYFDEKKKNIDDKINKDIFELNEIVKEINNIVEKIKAIGEFKAIEDENSKLLRQRDEIIKSSSMSEEEVKYYSEQLIKKDTINESIKEIKNNCIGAINIHKSYLESLKEDINLKLNDELDIKNDKNDIYRHIYNDIIEVIERGLNILENKKNEQELQIEKMKNEIELIDKSLFPYKKKMSQKNVIDNINNHIDKQNQLLNNLNNYSKELTKKKENRQKVIENLSDNLSQRYKNYIEFVNVFKQNNLVDMGSDVTIECTINADNKKLNDKVNDILNRNNNNNKILLKKIEEENIFIDDTIEIKKIIENSIEEKYICKNAYNKLDLIRAFTEDYFKFRFDIISQDTSFFNMSPGKQGLLLLKLILHMSNETYPILLDQPEDNLDNRTISSELKDFIKNKKISRQIIMVTHNANLAVLTDSEEIIVANQRGTDESEQKTLFDYVTGAMEYSFKNNNNTKILYKQGIREHLCEILEGGVQAFKARESKYEINRMLQK